MPLELRWLIQPQVTAFYAAGLIADSPAASHPLLAALAEPAQALLAACRACEVDFARLLDALMFHAAENTPPGEQVERALAERALAAATDPAASRHAAQLAPLIADLLEALAANQPRLGAELELRFLPLREQWEARGPGLWRQLARLTEPAALVDRAAVLPVSPLQGGGGRALIAYNSVALEAVLANPWSQLPEVARLAWFLALLNCNQACDRELLVTPRRVWPLAMIPPVLAAAAEVELARFELASLELALGQWQPRAQHRSELASVLWEWWQSHLETRPSWAAALAELEKLIA